MTERAREHAPKVAALRAEAAGLLSGEGRERLLRHVARCDLCAEHLRGARRFHALVSRATGQPSLDEGGAVERAMARNRLAQRRARVQWGGLAVAAGVLLAVILGTRQNEDHRAAAPPVAPPRAPAAAPDLGRELLPVSVTALRGEVHVTEPAQPSRLLRMDDAIPEHAVLRVEGGAAVDLAVGPIAGVHLGSGSELAFDAVRRDHVALRLARGTISSSVIKRASEQEYEILAAGHRIAVRGTRFAVRAGGPSGLGVRCDEGTVEVIAPNGERRLLVAPASWNERVILSPGEPSASEPELVVRVPHAHANGAVLALPVMAGIEAWEVGGATHPAGGELWMRVPPASEELVAHLSGGRRQVVRIEIDAVGAKIQPRDLELLAAPQDVSQDAPRERPLIPSNDEEDLDASSVILAGRPALQRCYERSLKNESSGSHALRLSITLDAQGRVRKVDPVAQRSGTELPVDLVRCIRATARSWRFPPPGGDGVTIEAPLRFQLRR